MIIAKTLKSAAAAAALVAAGAAQSTVIAVLPDHIGGFGTASLEAVGTFRFDASIFSNISEISSVVLSGTFGTSSSWPNDSTAAGDLLADGFKVATCEIFADCWLGGSGPVAFSYTFTPAQYTAFQDGQLSLVADKLYHDEVNRFGNLTLTVTAVPEPETYALMALGLGAIAWLRRRRN